MKLADLHEVKKPPFNEMEFFGKVATAMATGGWKPTAAHVKHALTGHEAPTPASSKVMDVMAKHGYDPELDNVTDMHMIKAFRGLGLKAADYSGMFMSEAKADPHDKPEMSVRKRMEAAIKKEMGMSDADLEDMTFADIESIYLDDLEMPDFRKKVSESKDGGLKKAVMDGAKASKTISDVYIRGGGDTYHAEIRTTMSSARLTPFLDRIVKPFGYTTEFADRDEGTAYVSFWKPEALAKHIKDEDERTKRNTEHALKALNKK